VSTKFGNGTKENMQQSQQKKVRCTDIETSDASGILGGLSLRIVEVRRDGDDGAGDGASKVRLGRLLHLHQSERSDLRGGVLVVAALQPSIAVGAGDDLEQKRRNKCGKSSEQLFSLLCL
jgi:hypothetical protein